LVVINVLKVWIVGQRQKYGVKNGLLMLVLLGHIYNK